VIQLRLDAFPKGELFPLSPPPARTRIFFFPTSGFLCRSATHISFSDEKPRTRPAFFFFFLSTRRSREPFSSASFWVRAAFLFIEGKDSSPPFFLPVLTYLGICFFPFLSRITRLPCSPPAFDPSQSDRLAQCSTRAVKQHFRNGLRVFFLRRTNFFFFPGALFVLNFSDIRTKYHGTFPLSRGPSD